MLAKFVFSSLTVVVVLTLSSIAALLTCSTSLLLCTGRACFFDLNLDRDGLAATFLGGDIFLRFRGVSSGKSTSESDPRFETSAIDAASLPELESAEDMPDIENWRVCMDVVG